MRRASEASLFFLGFPRKKMPHNGSCENSFAKAILWWMLLYSTLRKVTWTNMRKNMYYYAVTPRCAATAAVVSAVVLRRPTKEYTHPYSMMHRRLPTAGIEVTPHYHQLLVCCICSQDNPYHHTYAIPGVYFQALLLLTTRHTALCLPGHVYIFICEADMAQFSPRG